MKLVADWKKSWTWFSMWAASVIVAWGLINLRELRHLWQHEPLDRVSLVVTFLGTVTVSLEWAILGGLAMAWLTRQWVRRFGSSHER